MSSKENGQNHRRMTVILPKDMHEQFTAYLEERMMTFSGWTRQQVRKELDKKE